MGSVNDTAHIFVIFRFRFRDKKIVEIKNEKKNRITEKKMPEVGNVILGGIGLLVIAGTCVASPAVLLAALMSTDSGSTEMVLPILVTVPFGVSLGMWAIVATAAATD